MSDVITRETNNEMRQQIIQQIGRANIFAISGGRVQALSDGIELPVGSGYRVRVRLLANDTYRVERVMVRGPKTFGKGHCENVYCDEVGQLAYYASCFRNDGGQWTYHNPDASSDT